MFERRPILGILIGLTLCISIWRISVQEPSMYDTEFGYGNQLQIDDHRPSPTASEIKHTQAEPPESHPLHRHQYRSNYGRHMTDGRTTPHNFDNDNSISNNNLSLVSFTPSSPTEPVSSYDYESLPPNDYTKLIDLEDFKFVINQPPCPRGKTPYFLILVHSAPLNHEKRQLIRETWGSVQSPHLRLLFLVGAVASKQLQYRMERENLMFSDLIQGNFVDDYRNMTYKHVMALKWFVYHCPEASYLIKTDDDVFVNTLQLLEYVELQMQLQQQQQPPPPLLSPFTPRTFHVPSSSSSSSDSFSSSTSHIMNVLQSKNFLFCHKLAGARVKRSYRSKWRVSGREYPSRYYPVYCPGYSIMYSPDVVFRLYKEAQRSKYFWIDDVHITGTLAQLTNIRITDFLGFVIRRWKHEDILSGKTAFLFGWPYISDQEIRDLWALTLGHFNSTRSNGDGAYKHGSFRWKRNPLKLSAENCMKLQTTGLPHTSLPDHTATLFMESY